MATIITRCWSSITGSRPRKTVTAAGCAAVATINRRPRSECFARHCPGGGVARSDAPPPVFLSAWTVGRFWPCQAPSRPPNWDDDNAGTEAFLPDYFAKLADGPAADPGGGRMRHQA